MSLDAAMMQAWVDFIKTYKATTTEVTESTVTEHTEHEPKIEEIKDDEVTNLDNIEAVELNEFDETTEESAVETVEADTNESEKPKTSDGFFNIVQAGQMIAAHYKRQFPELKFVPPMNLVDGCVVDFMVGNEIVATARMRFRNRIHLSSETGEMVMMVQLSDLAYSRGEVKISINDEQTVA
ncbi:Hypothetical protein PACV_112 [Pacmanvirus A23]|uniref:Hypothetical protein n=1 Tax=Pacmanvirus A23 TaxID=1932881 RepID=UPI000A095125|nr:Hypothetical protein B9W72_gp111 [Pacmanvirus A23]SIP85828.1 Hypothetical protein PACV_112 [Pacmanvirus A23]